MTESARRRRNRRNLWRVISWGSSATVALAAVAFVSQTDRGGQRLELAFGNAGPAPVQMAAIGPPPAPAVPAAASSEAETRQLASQLRDLTADRDRLAARLASLERHLTDMTGSIDRQRPAMADPKPAEMPVAAAPVPAPEAPEVVLAAPEPAQAVTAPALPELPKFAAIAAPPGEPPRVIEPLAMPGAQPDMPAWSEPEKPAAAPVTVNVPLPPVRAVAVPATARPPIRRGDFGVDIGGSISSDSLVAQWAEVKANFGPILAGLHPAIGRDHRFGRAPYRLLIGPLPNAAAAARLCARLTASGLDCRPARFEGEQLAQF